MSKSVLLTYPDFTQQFDIYTDASDVQLGSVITQNKKPIAFYSRKLNPAQTRYTTGEQELLSLVETFKAFRNILLGHKIVAYTDHLNLTYTTFTAERVLRWRLLLEEYGPELRYVKGYKNVVADALSRLAREDSHLPHFPSTSYTLAESFGETDIATTTSQFPLDFQKIHEMQLKDKDLVQAVQSQKSFAFLPFHGGTIKLICKNNKIVIPQPLRLRITEWYHEMLSHPGMNRTEETIRQHFWWPKMREMINEYVEKCNICQRFKSRKSIMGGYPQKMLKPFPGKSSV